MKSLLICALSTLAVLSAGASSAVPSKTIPVATSKTAVETTQAKQNAKRTTCTYTVHISTSSGLYIGSKTTTYHITGYNDSFSNCNQFFNHMRSFYQTVYDLQY